MENMIFLLLLFMVAGFVGCMMYEVSAILLFKGLNIFYKKCKYKKCNKIE